MVDVMARNFWLYERGVKELADLFCFLSPWNTLAVNFSDDRL
jgi:hypothetical protein